MATAVENLNKHLQLAVRQLKIISGTVNSRRYIWTRRELADCLSNVIWRLHSKMHLLVGSSLLSALKPSFVIKHWSNVCFVLPILLCAYIYLVLQLYKHICRALEDHPGINYDQVQSWFSDHRMQGAAPPPEGKCLLHFDLILFAVSISKIHWITILVYLRQRAVYVLNSMDLPEVCMSPTSACWGSLQSSVPVDLDLSYVRASQLFQFLTVQNCLGWAY